MTYSITNEEVRRVTVEIPDTEDPRFSDHLYATWEPDRSGSGFGEYWLINGDNTGVANLVVYPYMIQPLRDLLAHLEDAT